VPLWTLAAQLAIGLSGIDRDEILTRMIELMAAANLPVTRHMSTLVSIITAGKKQRGINLLTRFAEPPLSNVAWRMRESERFPENQQQPV